MKPMAACLRLKSLQRSLEQEIQAWRSIQTKQRLASPGNLGNIPLKPGTMFASILVTKIITSAVERTANSLVLEELRSNFEQDIRTFTLQFLAEKTHIIVLERAASRVAHKRMAQTRRSVSRNIQERMTSTFENTFALLESVVDKLDGYRSRLTTLDHNIKLQNKLRRKKAMQSHQRRKSMIASTFTKPKISKQRSRRYSAPSAAVPLIITKASCGKIVWVSRLKSWGTIRFVGKVPGKPPGQWIGVSLSLPRGNSDGKGLFPCRSEKHGYFCKASDLLEHPEEGNPRERKKVT